MFKCDKCGECCRNLNKSPLYNNLHDGSGVCRYLKGNICSIYEERLILCRVDESYNIFFKDTMTLDKYYKLNYKSCMRLKKQL